MQVSTTGIRLIHHFEALRLKPYLCPAGKPTIGWGNTFYPNGKPVTLKDKPITALEAAKIFSHALKLVERDINEALANVVLTQAQFDVVASFTYNFGIGRLRRSTLLKLIIANPNNPDIPEELAKWRLADGKISPGLVRRRKAEGNYYTTGILKFY